MVISYCYFSLPYSSSLTGSCHSLEVFSPGYFKGEVGKPAVFCSTMPMLHVGWNMDDCAREDFLRRLAFLLIPATSGYTYQHLSATLCSVVRMPVVAATRLKGYVEERYLTVGYLCQITVALEVFGVSGVGFANREESSRAGKQPWRLLLSHLRSIPPLPD